MMQTKVMICATCGKTGVVGGELCPSCGTRQPITAEAIDNELVSVAVIDYSDPSDTLAPEPTAEVVVRRGSEPIGKDDPSATNPSSGHFCGRCGSVVNTEDEFCGICGNPLTPASLERTRSLPLHSGTLRKPLNDIQPFAFDTQPSVKTYRVQTNDEMIMRILGALFIVAAALVALAALYFALKR